jgi:hypothetical protein
VSETVKANVFNQNVQTVDERPRGLAASQIGARRRNTFLLELLSVKRNVSLCWAHVTPVTVVPVEDARK